MEPAFAEGYGRADLVGAGTGAGTPAVYRPRQPRNSPLYQLLEAHYEEVKALWEERFQQNLRALARVFAVGSLFEAAPQHLIPSGGARMRTIPVPYVNTRKAEELFRHRVLRLLKDKGHLREERIQLLLSLEEKWRSGFSIDDSVRIPAGQQRAIEHVARYRLRAPVSLSRLRWSRDDSEVFYIAKGSHDDPEAPSVPARRIETLEFVARVIAQIPQPRRHLLFYYGRYSHVVRGKRRKSQPHPAAAEETRPHPAEEPTLSPARKAALRRRWADLIRWVYEVDPLLCERCGGQLRVIGFITEPRVIGKILEHLEKRDRHSRAPPPAQPVSVS